MKRAAGVLQKILPPLWCGMLLAIAMEAQLKFGAPGITRELGLGIGKLVFTALNRVELVIAMVLAVALFALPGAAAKRAKVVFGLIAVILLAQTVWLLPLLIERIDLIVAGQAPPASPGHLIYIALEVSKITLLLVLSVLVNLSNEN